MRAPQRLQLPYTRTMFAALLYRPDPADCLIVGLGGGAMVRFLNHFFPGVQVDVVEIDPEIVRVARQYFGAAAGPRTRIVTDDGAAFLARAGQRYDLVLLDAFLPPGEGTDVSGVPLRLKTEAFLATVRQRLAADGVAAFNLHEGPSTARDVEAIRAAFPHIEVFRPPGTGNVIVVASAGAMPAEAALVARARALDGRRDHGFSFHRLLDQRRRG
jgi:spermidine synthase